MGDTDPQTAHIWLLAAIVAVAILLIVLVVQLLITRWIKKADREERAAARREAQH